MNLVKRMKRSAEMLGALCQGKDIKGDAGLLNLVWNMKTLDSKIQLWFENGAKTFILSRELIDAFMHTDVSMKLCPEDFQYPFDTFWIEGEGPLFHVDKAKIPVSGLLFTHSKIVQDRAIFADIEGNRYDKIEWLISISAVSPGTDVVSHNLGLDQMWVNMCLGKSMEDTYHIASQPEAVTYRDPIIKSEAQHIMNMFFNTVLYINDPTREPETSEPKYRKMKLPGTGRKRVKCSYIYLRPPKGYNSTNISTSGGRKVDVRFIVRGHWRNQPYGKGRSLVKRVWIKPFWKGPDVGEVSKSKYKLK